MLPAALARRLDALAAAPRTAPPQTGVTPEARVLLLLAEAARDGRHVAFTYTDRADRGSERVLFPYGVVAHAGRWYATGLDSASGEVRTFRLDRIEAPAVRAGTVEAPAGFDAADHVLAGLARTPWLHRVSVLVEGPAEEVRDLLPAGLAAVREAGTGGVRVELRAERLDWVPALLVGLRRPFVVERPEELRTEVRALADRLTAYADLGGERT